MLTLYHIPSSPYAEKARWALDYKRLDYRSELLFPGRHADVVERIAGTRTVPVLVDSDAAEPITDSTDILLHLENVAPEPSLIPADETQRARALEIEDWLDENAARPIARFSYSFISESPAAFAAYFTHGLSAAQRLGGQLLRPVLPRMIAAFRAERELSREAAEGYRREILEMLDRLEQMLDVTGDGVGRRYLVGESFSVADLTAACMLAMAMRLSGSPWEMGAAERRAYRGAEAGPVRELRAAIVRRPAGAWAVEIWKRHRGGAVAGEG